VVLAEVGAALVKMQVQELQVRVIVAVKEELRLELLMAVAEQVL
jgi:hypothetical protein